MAPSPRIQVAENLSILEDEEQYMVGSDDDDEEPSSIRYYKSERALGQLYRAVDEREFLQELKLSSKDSRSDLLDELLEYVNN
jgi:hypothetical protein